MNKKNEPEQLELFAPPPPRDKQAALERAAAIAGVTPAELKQRAHIIDATAVVPEPRGSRRRRRANVRKIKAHQQRCAELAAGDLSKAKAPQERVPECPQCGKPIYPVSDVRRVYELGCLCYKRAKKGGQE